MHLTKFLKWPLIIIILCLGRGVYKGDKIHGKASSNHFDSLSSRPRRFKPKPRFQDGIDLPKELRQQRSTTSGEYSFDLELGASASKVNQRQKEKESLKPTNSCLQKIPKGTFLKMSIHNNSICPLISDMIKLNIPPGINSWSNFQNIQGLRCF